MKKLRIAALAVFILSASLGLEAQQATVSVKQDVAVFALGYYGFDISQSVLANVDAEIQGVFVNLGRFNVLGQTERFSTKDVQDFINLIQNAKQNNTPLPESVRFGEVQLTEALMRQLFGSFVVVIPTIVDFSSERGDNGFQTTIKTSVTFLNVAEGKTMGMANIQTSGSSKESRNEATRSAISAIPFQLSYEVRRIEAFKLQTQALQVGLFDVKMQLGRDMGVVVGDEFVVVERYDVGGFIDEREDGLILIKNVGPQVSTGTIMYSGSALRPGAQLREVPRLGVEVAPYLLYLRYFDPVVGWKIGTDKEESESEGALAVGIKGIASRGFYALRPLAGVQMNFDTKLWLPIIVYGGLEYNIYLRRIALTASASIAGASNAIVRLIEEEVSEDDDPWFTHYGVKLDAGASILVSREMRVFGRVNMDYLFGIGDALGGPFQSYGGYGFSAGLQFKL